MRFIVWIQNEISILKGETQTVEYQTNAQHLTTTL